MECKTIKYDPVFSGAGISDLSNNLAFHACLHPNEWGFLVMVDWVYLKRDTVIDVATSIVKSHQRAHYLMLLKTTEYSAPFYVFFAAQFLNVKEELEINSSYCGLWNPGNVFHGDNLVSMHT